MPARSSRSVILALDIGTSSTRSAIFNAAGRRLPATAAARQYSVRYGNDGRAELLPLELLHAVTRSLNQTRRAYRSGKDPITAISASAFWHGLLGLDRKFRPVTPIYTWADSRAGVDARRLRQRFDERRIQQRTGCMLRAPYWPAKLWWLRRVNPKLFRRVVWWVSPCDWIFRELFGDLKTSPSMASGTGLFNLRAGAWDRELLRACEIDAAILPEIGDGLTNSTGPEIVFCPIGDGAAGNRGSGGDRPFIAAINVGTSAAVRTVQSTSKSSHRALPIGLFRYVLDGSRHIIGGATSNAGNLRQWCLRELEAHRDPAALESMLSRKAAAQDRLTVLPFWVEERAPTWPEGLTGVIEGVNQSTTAPMIVRSAATAVFYRLRQILELMDGTLGRMRRVIVSGGILKSPASVRLLADALGRDIEVAREGEASLRGAALHALSQLGDRLPRSRPGRIIKHNRRFAALHKKRLARQVKLEALMTRSG